MWKRWGERGEGGGEKMEGEEDERKTGKKEGEEDERKKVGENFKEEEESIKLDGDSPRFWDRLSIARHSGGIFH